MKRKINLGQELGYIICRTDNPYMEVGDYVGAYNDITFSDFDGLYDEPIPVYACLTDVDICHDDSQDAYNQMAQDIYKAWKKQLLDLAKSQFEGSYNTNGTSSSTTYLTGKASIGIDEFGIDFIAKRDSNILLNTHFSKPTETGLIWNEARIKSSVNSHNVGYRDSFTATFDTYDQVEVMYNVEPNRYYNENARRFTSVTNESSSEGLHSLTIRYNLNDSKRRTIKQYIEIKADSNGSKYADIEPSFVNNELIDDYIEVRIIVNEDDADYQTIIRYKADGSIAFSSGGGVVALTEYNYSGIEVEVD